jgi:hypothetical protein
MPFSKDKQAPDLETFHVEFALPSDQATNLTSEINFTAGNKERRDTSRLTMSCS